MEQIKWFDRKFDFSTNSNIFPIILERLSATPLRLEEKFQSMPTGILTERIYKTWSIKENLGHLIDLEPLWQGRFEDILKGETELRPTDLQNTQTDLQNTQTDLANHNETPV